MVRKATGMDFAHYKQATLSRRIERRIAFRNSPGIHEYATSLRDDPGEVRELFNDLLINVTGFFPGIRDVRSAEKDRAAPAAGGTRRGGCRAGLGAGLLIRGGGLFPCHRAHGVHERGGRTLPDSGLRYRYQRAGAVESAGRQISGGRGRGHFARAPAELLQPGGRPLPDQ